MLAKKIILTCLLIIWMGLIFMFSNQDAVKSENVSDNVASIVIDKVNPNLEEKEKEILVEDTRVIVRKTAHIMVFLGLGIIAYFTFKAYDIKKLLLVSFLFCIGYATLDEIHQLFINGRNFSVLDILIDTVGSGLGIIFSYIITKNLTNRKKSATIVSNRKRGIYGNN